MSEKRLTTNAGRPVADNQNVMTAGRRGPQLLQDVWFLEKLAHFDREVIPERRMHAKGSGAYGTFTVTHDITNFTRAKVFSTVGKKTELFARFTTVAGERGAADAERDIRGFAVKFYTEEGNWDLWIALPEALHQVTIVMSDRGIPATYRHMHGFGSHTFGFINAGNERHWVKFHFQCQQGIRNLLDLGEGSLPPVRPDQGPAPRGLSADRRGSDGAQPQSGELLRRGRAVGVQSCQRGAWHRLLTRQDAAGPAVQLRRCAALPARRQSPPDSGECRAR